KLKGKKRDKSHRASDSPTITTTPNIKKTPKRARDSAVSLCFTFSNSFSGNELSKSMIIDQSYALRLNSDSEYCCYSKISQITAVVVGMQNFRPMLPPANEKPNASVS